jgi:hypothetical protein
MLLEYIDAASFQLSANHFLLREKERFTMGAQLIFAENGAADALPVNGESAVQS